MKSSKIISLNTNPEASNSLLVKAKQYNDVVEDLDFLYPKTNQRFEGKIYLGRMYTQYANYAVSATLEVGLLPDLVTGGSAEIRFIGDGATTPTFSSSFVASAGTDVYDTTLNTVNKVVFYYDGASAFYSITVL